MTQFFHAFAGGSVGSFGMPEPPLQVELHYRGPIVDDGIMSFDAVKALQAFAGAGGEGRVSFDPVAPSAAAPGGLPVCAELEGAFLATPTSFDGKAVASAERGVWLLDRWCRGNGLDLRIQKWGSQEDDGYRDRIARAGANRGGEEGDCSGGIDGVHPDVDPDCDSACDRAGEYAVRLAVAVTKV